MSFWSLDFMIYVLNPCAKPPKLLTIHSSTAAHRRSDVEGSLGLSSWGQLNLIHCILVMSVYTPAKKPLSNGCPQMPKSRRLFGFN